MAGFAGRGAWGWVFGFLIFLFAAFIAFVDVIAFLAWVGEISHTGVADPTAVKVYVIVAVVWAFLYFVGYAAWVFFQPSEKRPKGAGAVYWLYFWFIVLFAFLTAWAFIWDSRHGGKDVGDTFAATGGSPVVSHVGDDPDRSMLKAFDEWVRVQGAIAFVATLFLVLMGIVYRVARVAAQAMVTDARSPRQFSSRPTGFPRPPGRRTR